MTQLDAKLAEQGSRDLPDFEVLEQTYKQTAIVREALHKYTELLATTHRPELVDDLEVRELVSEIKT